MLEPQQRFPAPLQGYSGLGEVTTVGIVKVAGALALLGLGLHLARKTKTGRRVLGRVRPSRKAGFHPIRNLVRRFV